GARAELWRRPARGRRAGGQTLKPAVPPTIAAMAERWAARRFIGSDSLVVGATAALGGVAGAAFTETVGYDSPSGGVPQSPNCSFGGVVAHETCGAPSRGRKSPA